MNYICPVAHESENASGGSLAALNRKYFHYF